MIDHADSAPHYRWQAPGGAISVDLSLDVVEQLGLAVREPEASFSYRFSEIGGLLLGTVGRLRGETVVQVKDFEPVGCEHAFGASYLLSGDDQRGLARQLRRHGAVRACGVVGFFRSNTRKEFALTAEDIDLMAAHFSKPSMVLLMVHLTPGGKLRGAFWDQSALRIAKPSSEFPFDAEALLAESGPVRRPRPSYAAVEPARATIVPVPETEVLPARRATVNMRRPPAMLDGSFRSGAAQARAQAAKLLARARRQWSQPSALLPGRWRVEWLVAAAALGIATLGGLVHQGGRQAVAAIDARQLVRSKEEAARPADAPPPIEIGPVAALQPAQADATAETAAPAGGDTGAPSAPPVQRVKRKGRARSKTAPFPLAPQLAAVTPAPRLPDPPSIATEPSAAEPPVAWSGIPFPAYEVPDPFVRIAVDPVPYGHRGLIGRLLSRKSSERAAFDPPRVLREPPPEIPSELRNQVRNTVPVTVKLYLDRAGKVDNAELLSKGKGRSRDLAARAVVACRKWQFSPAHMGGETVPAEVLVRFVFGAGTETVKRIPADEH